MKKEHIEALDAHHHPTHAYHASLSLLDRAALFVTNSVGTMWCAFAFCILAFVSLPAALHSGDPLVIVSWISQTLIQLVLLPIIIVGQNLQGRHSELRAESDYRVNVKAEKEILGIVRHLDAQDKTIVEILEHLKGTHNEVCAN